MKADSFKIKLDLLHASMDPIEITEVFSIQPNFSWKAGSCADKIVHKWTVWNGTLAEGKKGDDFDEALKKALTVLEGRKDWLAKSFIEDGELDVVFSFCTDLIEGIINEVEFYPELLERLTKLNAGIKFQVWMEDAEDTKIEDE